MNAELPLKWAFFYFTGVNGEQNLWKTTVSYNSYQDIF